MQSSARTLRHLTQGLAALILLLTSSLARAAEDRTVTVVFFADEAMTDQQWSSLFARTQSEAQRYHDELSKSPAALAEEHLDLLRGDRIQPGLTVQNAVTVYLRGDCAHLPVTASFHQPSPHPEALGWVERSNDQIQPFIHIDCALIGQLLRTSSLSHTADRNDLAALAVARVFVHEWMHVETQSSHHTRTGIAKSTFTAFDLVGNRQAVPGPAHPHADDPILPSPAHGK